jgi:Cu(I)/Ag(I) efflux system membrane protein CusA/SilA
VGGMITAPLLSMFVIPAAYLLIRKPRKPRKPREHKASRFAFWRRRDESA